MRKAGSPTTSSMNADNCRPQVSKLYSSLTSYCLQASSCSEPIRTGRASIFVIGYIDGPAQEPTEDLACRCNHIQEGQWQRLWPRHQEQAGFYANARCKRNKANLLCWSQSHVHVRSSCQHRTKCTIHGHVGLTAICSKSFELTNFLQSHAHTQREAHDFHTAELGCCILPTSNLLVK